MYKVKLMNKISSVGLDYFNEDYEYGETLENEDAILQIGRASCRERV